ncbi:MAG: hypothetical protein QM811_16295 [Pirellulales bacterium]
MYHALPHGLHDPLGKSVAAEIYVDVETVYARKRAALAAHASQKSWLDVSQGMDSYLSALDDASRAVAAQTGRFAYAEGWRRHSHLGLSTKPQDPLRDALGDLCWVNPRY